MKKYLPLVFSNPDVHAGNGTKRFDYLYLKHPTVIGRISFISPKNCS